MHGQSYRKFSRIYRNTLLIKDLTCFGNHFKDAQAASKKEAERSAEIRNDANPGQHNDC